MGEVKWSRINSVVGGVLALHAAIYTTVVSCVVQSLDLRLKDQVISRLPFPSANLFDPHSL